MAARSESSDRKSSKQKKGAGDTIRNVVASGVAADTLIDLVSRLGLVDLVIGRAKAKIEETDIDELLEDATDYLRRNPEVLVASLGALTVATGLLVLLNSKRAWDGTERREVEAAANASKSSARRNTSRSSSRSDEDR